jgi:DNA-binding PadR family transcriptional regulator
MVDERRIYYAITGAGRKALQAELDRYRSVVAVATAKRLTPKASTDGA